MPYLYKNIVDGKQVVSVGVPAKNAQLSTIIEDIPLTWNTIYDVDFTKLEKREYYGDETIEINGVEWEIINCGALRNFEVNEKGLMISCSRFAVDFFDDINNAPMFRLPIKNLFSVDTINLSDINDYDFRLIADCLIVDQTHDYENVFVGLEIRTALPKNNSITHNRYYNCLFRDQIVCSTIVTNENKSEEKIIEIASDSCVKNISVFEIKDKFEILNQFYSPETEEPVQLCSWSPIQNGLLSEPAISSVCDLNFLFGISTTFEFRMFSGFLRKLEVQVKPK